MSRKKENKIEERVKEKVHNFDGVPQGTSLQKYDLTPDGFPGEGRLLRNP